jgi:hypothetical protein
MGNIQAPGVAINSPVAVNLLPFSGEPSCTGSNGGTCIPALATGSLPGATFLVRDNAGKPLIYSVDIVSQVASDVGAYDFFMTVEQLE